MKNSICTFACRARGLLQRLRAAFRNPRPPVAREVRARFAAADPKPVRVAVIGAGRVARAHLAVLRDLPGVQLVGIANRGQHDLAPLAKEFGIGRTSGDWRALIDEVKPDAILVQVSVAATAPVVRELLPRGIPLLIEKPAGLTSQETAELAALAAQHDCLNMVAVNRRFYSAIDHALRAVLARGPLLGIGIELHEPIANLRRAGRFPPEVLARWMAANGIHAIDLFRRCAGDMTTVHALRRTTDGAADAWVASLQTATGTLGTFAAFWDSPPSGCLQLYGRGVSATLGNFQNGSVLYADGLLSPIPIDEVDVAYKPGFYAQDATFIAAVRQHAPPAAPASDLADQVKTMQLIEQIEAGAGASHA